MLILPNSRRRRIKPLEERVDARFIFSLIPHTRFYPLIKYHFIFTLKPHLFAHVVFHYYFLNSTYIWAKIIIILIFYLHSSILNYSFLKWYTRTVMGGLRWLAERNSLKNLPAGSNIQKSTRICVPIFCRYPFIF